MGRRISKEFLHPSILEGVNNKIGNLDSLETDAKGNMVQAINELVEKLDNSAELEALEGEIENGKELIANAVGEPLTVEESFDEMSNDINGLLSQFKTNMMNNGITVESSDRFKSLIDKIATMVEEGGGKGIQFAEGKTIEIDYASRTDYGTIKTVIETNLDFIPNYIFVCVDTFINSKIHKNLFFSNLYKTQITGGTIDGTILTVTNINQESFTISVLDSSFYLGAGTYYAIGVGEEDTTLRDSLASILQEEGVSVTEEDNMASLITKVDEEFDRKNEEIENIQQNVIPIKKIIVTDTLPTTVTDDIVLLTNIPAPNIYTTQIPDDYGYNDNYDNWSNVIPVEGDIVFNLAHGYNDSNTYNKIIISYDNVTITLTIMDIYQYINGEWDGSIMYKAYGNKNGVWTKINGM